MNIPEFRLEEFDLREIAHKLTWYDWTDVQLRDSDSISLPMGTLLKSSDGFIEMVGSVDCIGQGGGCGCCTNDAEFIQIAFLSEVLL